MKRKKNMLILLACLVVLIGAACAATMLDFDSSTTPTEGTVLTVFTVDTGAVEELAWKYSEDVAFKRTGDSWEYADDDAFPLDESYIEAALEAVSEITASRSIEGVTDWDQYGLEVPVCTISVTTDVTRTLSIGNETSLGGERYFSIGDGNAYLVDASIITPFNYGLYDLMEYETIPSLSSITGVDLESEEQSYGIQYLENSGKVYSDEYVWFMGDKVLDNELTQNFLYELTAVSWQKCVEYNAADLSKYGLDEPVATVTFHYTESVTEDDETMEQAASFTLEIGGETGDYRYARIAGSSMVYLIDENICETLLYTTYQELRPDEVLLLDWDTLESLDITLDGTAYTLRKYTRNINDGGSGSIQETVYLMDETELEIDGIFTVLDEMTVTGYAAGIVPEHSQELKLVFHRDHDTFPEVELTFYQYDSDQCLAMLNGEATVLVSREDVVDLVEDIDQLLPEE